MSESRFDPKKFLEYKFTAHQDLLNVLRPKPSTRSRPPEKQRSFILDLIKAVVIAIVLIAAIKIFLVETVAVSSDAMEPTLGVGDIVVINKISYGIANPFWGAAQTRRLVGLIPNPFFGRIYQLSRGRYFIRLKNDPRRSDLVAVRSPMKGLGGRILVKRIIGLPGELISMKNGTVFINGKKFFGKVKIAADRYNMQQKRVPYGSYFVMGDKRAASADSRMYGPLSGNDIVGQVMMRIWPVGKPRAVK